ncbi:MAG: PD-(D/E)XK nuclease family protein [Lachnospiraceae bacterium]|nr:PD-(D/E)XK nuclease family protein [Lachnospiraceae bacterium]
MNILLGPAGSGKSTALFSRAVEKAEKDIRKNHLVIVPEQASHTVTDRLIALSKRHGIMNIDVLSFNRLAHRIFDNAGGNAKEIIDDTGKNLILKTVISEHEGELTALKKNVSRTGYINEIKSVISEFVQYEITPDDVKKFSENSGKKYLAAKLKDIYILYKTFREKLEERYVTREELLDRAAEAADRAAFLKGACLYFDDFTGFTPIQYRFLSEILKITDEVSLCLDYDGFDGELFSLSVNTIKRIRDIGESLNYKIETLHFYDNKENRFKDSTELSLLEKKLFRERKEGNSDPGTEVSSDPGTAGNTDTISDIEVIKCLNPEREAECVIEKVMALVRSGMRYREIGIVMSDPKLYSNILSAEAEREGIPLFIDSTTEILLNPYTEFIRAALEAVISNMSYESVFHFVRSGLTGIEEEKADRLENYVRAMNIRGKKKYREAFRIHTGRLSEEELKTVNEVREKLINLLEPLMDAVGGGRKNAGFITEELKRFIQVSGIDERAEELSDKLREEGRIREADALSQIPDSVSELLNKIESLIPNEKTNLKEYLEILDAGFEAMRIGVLPPGLDCVRAGDTERSRMDNIRVLFFMGLNDGLIPAAGTGAGLLSELDREFLKESGMELSPTARERTLINKFYFYMNVTGASEKLVLSYSLSDSGGKALNPSFFLNEIKSVFPALTDTLYIKRQEIYSDNDLYAAFAASLKEKDGLTNAGNLYAALRSDPEKRKVFDDILDFCFKIHGEDSISEAVSRVLYEENSNRVPTRLERYAECAYRHFMVYGLRAMEREEFGFERRDMGSVLHNVLNLYSLLLKQKGKNYRDLGDEETEALAGEALDKYLSENENLVLFSSERNKYFIRRISRILRTTVKAIKKQSMRGGFNPELFEKSFNTDGLKGRIDRIDTAEAGDTIYVSVIDYKSGNKSFDLSRIYYGLDMQLVIYLKGAMEIERIAHPDAEIKPAGIFYYHIADPVIKEEELKSGTPGESEERKMEALKLRGIVNSDPEVIRLFDGAFDKKSSVVPVSFNKDGSFSAQSSVADSGDFRVITDHVQKKAFEIGERIGKGEIEPSPAIFDNKSPCDYCPYSDCCRFDLNTAGFKERRMKKMKGTEALQCMKDPAQDDKGDAQDDKGVSQDDN